MNESLHLWLIPLLPFAGFLLFALGYLEPGNSQRPILAERQLHSFLK